MIFFQKPIFVLREKSALRSHGTGPVCEGKILTPLRPHGRAGDASLEQAA